MYGQGGYNPQFGRGPHTPLPSAYQQLPVGHPSPYLQQGPLVPPTSVVQHHPHGPPHVGPPAASIYQHVCSAQAPSIDQAPPSGIPNTSQSYLQPSTSATGVIPLSHMYQTVQHNSQQPLHLGTQNVYHRPLQIPPPPPPLGQLHLPPNRVLPPPPIPSQAQALFRPLIHPLPQHPGGQGLQNIPPPPISNFVATASIGSIVPPEAPPSPPTPPFSPPPVPPSPPQTSDDDIVAPDEVKEIVPVLQGLLNQEGRSGSEGPLVGHGVISKGSMMLDLSPPSRKPTEEKVVQKIEVLCHSIAENGPDYEDMTRQNEYGNPEFEFLFGGEPGSEAAIAHEYFLWMKKKYLLAHKSNVETSDPPLTSSGNNSLSQTDNSVVAAVSHPSPDSDMEMEDDITQPDPDQGVSYSIGGLNCKSDLINIEPNVKEQLSASQSSKECSPSKDVLSEKVSFRGSPVLDEGVPIVPVATMNSTGAAEQLLASSLDKSGTALSNDTSLLKACAAAEEICSEKSSGLCNKSSSPFRLIQEYASDDGSENNADPCLENVSPVTVSLSVGHTNLHRDAGFNLEADIGSKNLSESENEFVQGSESRVLCKGEEFSVDSPRKFKGAVISSTASGMTGELVRKKPESVTIKHAASFEALQKDCGGTYVADTFTDKLQKNNEEKNLSSTETKQKVDKFGRLLRKGASDSDSDDLQYVGRHRTRGRSWSRSQSRSRSRSPPDRRRRRSPRKRREKRSLSRSWSPRNRRSRSRSPTYRRVADFIGDNTRQDKGRSPVCFDFLRGRCYRGRSCRFLHHDSHKGDISRRHRSRQGYLEDLPSSKTSIINKEIKHIGQAVPNHEHDYVKNTEMLLSEDTSGSSFHASGGGNIDQKKEDSSSDALRSGFGSNVAHLIDSRRVSSESYGQTAAKAQTQVVQEMPRGLIPINEDYEVAEDFHKKPIGPNDASQIVVSPSKKSGSQQSEFSPSGPVPPNNDGLPQQTDNSSIADASPDRTSKTFLNELPVSKASTNATQLTPSQLNSQGASDPHRTLPPSDYKLNPNSLPEESFPPYMLPNQNSNFYGPPGSSWTTLPPPPPLPSHNLTPGVSSQIQHCHLPPRNDFGSQSNSGAYTTELPAYSLGGGLQQQAYPPVNEHHQPLLHSAMPMYNPLSQQFKGHSLLREDCFRQPPMQGFSAANSLPTGNNYPQTGSFLYELSENKMQPFSWDSLPPGEILKSSSQINPYLQQQLPSCSIQHSAADNLYCLPGNSRSSSRYPPDVLDTNQPSCMPNFGESRSSTCYNSYASAFEGPLNSKLSPDKFRKENDATNNCTSFTMNHAPADGRGVSSVGLKQGTSSPTSTKAVGQNFPSSAGDQYDPLFDSIEPSSKLSKKSDYVRKWEPANDSDIMLRLKPLNIEENNQRDEVGAVDPATSVVNEECGETADAEVDDNRSPSDPADIANMNGGEFEIDQIKSPGKNTKRKESRSLKLFKVALAEFVKEVLKPSWRQGNMSKEAFKTIVKKTVDKVSGAMRSHQIPKSRAKINQYIDSSQRKLTKLVMGYVDKYVKV